MKTSILLIRKIILFIFLFNVLIIPFSINAQGWEQSFGSSSTPRSIIQTMDGGYLTLNYKWSGSHLLFTDISLRKLNSNGEEEWDKIIEGGYRRDLGGVIETPNGDLVVVSSGENSANNDLLQIDIFKLDNNGIEIWQKSIDNAVRIKGNSILLSNDGNYIIGGTIFNSIDNMPTKENLLLIKLSPEGDLIWEQYYSNNYNSYSRQYGLSQTSDDGFILTGYGNNNPNGRSAICIKTDSEGVEEWKNSYDVEDNFARDIFQMDDGSYRLFCSFRNNGSYYSKLVMLKLNEMGEIQQELTIDSISFSVDYPHKVKKTADGNFIVFTNTFSSSITEYNYRLYKLDPNGNILWENEYGQNHWSYGFDFQITSDGGFIMIGAISYVNIGGIVYIVKTDESGEYISNTFELSGNENVKIYPNPTDGIFSIKFELPRVSEVQVRIYDITGKEILTSPKQSIFENKLEFNLSSFTDGVYIVKITVDDSVLAKRIVLQKF